MSKVIKTLYHQEIDLVLLDMVIPKITGFDLCKLLKQNEDLKHIPIVFMTNKPNYEDIQRGFELGAIDYIVKPFTAKEFNIRITNYLELNSYRNQLEEKVEKTLREHQYTQKLLLQTAKQAELGELIMHIAHQWKQPLSELGSINNFLMAKIELEKDVNRTELTEYVRKNENILNFMSNTVNTFQNFYKPNSKDELFSIEEAITDGYFILGATFDYYNIQYKCEVNEKVNTFGNKNEFSQIILALLINAKNIFVRRNIKKPKLVIRGYFVNNHYIIEVKDNGGGIDQDKIEDIFEPFTSDDSTGVGLSMVKIICMKNDWSISVENKDNGAYFYIKVLPTIKGVICG